jgi:hypothetical protein
MPLLNKIFYNVYKYLLQSYISMWLYEEVRKNMIEINSVKSKCTNTIPLTGVSKSPHISFSNLVIIIITKKGTNRFESTLITNKTQEQTLVIAPLLRRLVHRLSTFPIAFVNRLLKYYRVHLDQIPFFCMWIDFKFDRFSIYIKKRQTDINILSL